MDLDDPVCLCFRVTRRRLERHLRLERPRVPSQLSECGGAGTGCGWCVPYLEALFQSTSAAGGGAARLALPLADYRERRADYLRSRAAGGAEPEGPAEMLESPP